MLNCAIVGINWGDEGKGRMVDLLTKDYDVVVVKQGYLWPGAAELAATQVFCMTPGTATNDFSTLPFKHLEGDYYFVKPERRG